MTAPPPEPPARRTDESPRRPWTRRLVAVVLVLAALYPLYLAAANLFLASPLALRAANRRPERVALHWQRAWTLYPGDLRVRGLTVEIHTRTSGWRLGVESGTAAIDLPALADRRFRVSAFDGEGFTAEPIPTEPLPERPPAKGGQPWRFEFDRIEVAGATEIGLGPLRLVGDGRLAGSFRRTSHGPFALPGATLKLAGARLLAGDDPVADGLEVTAEAEIAPYVPADHPGLAGLDFVTGTLAAHGDLRAWPRLAEAAEGSTAPAAPPPPGAAGELEVDLRLESGTLAPGSRLAFRAPETAGEGETGAFRVVFEVAAEPAPPRLSLALDAPGFTLPHRGGGRPLLHAEALTLTASTPERRLARLLADARELGSGGSGGSGDRADSIGAEAGGLWGEFEAGVLALELGGTRVTWGLDVDRARGRLDLAALARREVRLDGVRAEGVVSRLAFLASAPASSKEAAAEPPVAHWVVSVTDLEIEGLREVGFGDVVVAGAGRCDGGLSYDRDGVLAVPAARISVGGGRITVGGEPAADRLDLRLAGGLDGLPGRSAEGGPGGAALIHGFSGTFATRARISSLGFLRRYLAATPWLALRGRGDLSADLALDRGSLRPGSEFAIRSARVEATLLDDLATGEATVSGRVEGPAEGPRMKLGVVFHRFALGPRGLPPHVRGSGLTMTAVTSVVDLTSPVEDLVAEVDLRDGEVPDLTSYNTYFPASAGLAIVGGHGRLRFHLRLTGGSGGAGSGGGELSLSSNDLGLLFKELRMDGRLSVDTRLSTSSLQDRGFDLDGTRLVLEDVTYHDLAEETADAKAGWWARIELSDGSFTWSRPLVLDASLNATMRDTGLLMSLFAQRKRYLKWFEGALTIEGVAAEGHVRFGEGEIRIEPFTAASGNLTLRSRLRLAKGVQRGDLLIRHGVFKVGIELRDGERDFKLLRPEAWFERREGFD